MTDAEMIAELERLNAERTQGEWARLEQRSADPRFYIGQEIRGPDPDPSSKYEWPPRICQSVVGQIREEGDRADFAFIAAVANALPRLLALAKAGAELQAKLTARANDMVKARERLINIRDELEDEGDRVYFGSTNDADAFKAAVEMLDEWAWSDIMDDGKHRDYIAECRDLRAEIERLTAANKALVEAVTFYRDGFVKRYARGPTEIDHSKWIPTEALLEDAGGRAQEVLEVLAQVALSRAVETAAPALGGDDATARAQAGDKP